MKKICFVCFLVAVIFSASVQNVEAKDVWVDHWDYENADIYVMDDTIVPSESARNYFSVSTKEVKNGKLLKVISWKFSKYKDDMWRYETSNMDGMHTTVVSPGNKVFEFCMNRLGWSYRVKEFWVY